MGKPFLTSLGVGTNNPTSWIHLVGTSSLGVAGVSALQSAPHTVTLTGSNPTTYATLHGNQLGSPTLVGTNAGQTVTDAATLSVAGPPVQSTNVTLTNSYGLKIDPASAGTATNAYGAFIDAPTGATNNYGLIVKTGNVGLLNTAPTHALTLGTGGTQVFYNTSDQTTNWERFEMGWGLVNANVFELRTNKAGTGTARSIRFYYAGSSLTAITLTSNVNGGVQFSTTGLSTASASGRLSVALSQNNTSTSGNSVGILYGENYVPTSTSTMVAQPIRIASTINYSNATPGAGHYEALSIAITETALPTGQNYLVRAAAGSAGTTDKFVVLNSGFTGVQTTVPTAAFHAASAVGATAFHAYNTSDEATNYERLEMGWGINNVNVFDIRLNKGGTGTNRTLAIYYGGSTKAAIKVTSSTDAGIVLGNNSNTNTPNGLVVISDSNNATSGNAIGLSAQSTYNPTSTSTMVAIPLRISPTINYSNATPGAGSYEALKIAVTETALPTGQSYLIRASAGSAGTTDRFLVGNKGDLTNIFVDAATTTLSTVQTISHNSSGTPAVGFGSSTLWQLQSSTTTNRNAAEIDISWVTATDASRAARLTISAWDATAAREGIRVESNSSSAFIGIGGAVDATAIFNVNGTCKATAFTGNGSGLTNVNAVQIQGINISATTPTSNQILIYTGGAWTPSANNATVGIGSAITSGTSGSVLFIDSSGNLAQDNTNFFWDNTNKRLGIGSNSPSATLYVRAAQPAAIGTATGTNATTAFDVLGMKGGNTTIATTGTGGAGGIVYIYSGDGGTASSALTSATGGQGGAINLRAGGGGTQSVAATTNTGGLGGAAFLGGGNAGDATTGTTQIGGAGGPVTIQGGAGGFSSTGTGGNGGSVYISAGIGGAGNVNGTPGDIVLSVAQPGLSVVFEAARIKNNTGYFGVNTTSPASMLDINGVISCGGYPEVHVGKNAIINGAFDVWQRGTSFSNISNQYLCDRWSWFKSGTYTISSDRASDQPSISTTVPYTTYALRATVGTGASMSAGQYGYFSHKIEGYVWNRYLKRAVTISFWVKSSITGTYSATLRAGGLDQTYCTTYTINNISTWEFKSISIPAPTAGTFNTDSSTGVELMLALGIGTGISTLNSWQSGNPGAGASTQTNFLFNNGATFYLSQVQIEVGTIATPFEIRHYPTEFLLCQRYYRTSYATGKYAADAADDVQNVPAMLATGVAFLAGYIPFIPWMRAKPTVTIYSPKTGTSGKVRLTTASTDVGTSVAANQWGESAIALLFDSNNPFTAGTMYCFDYVADAEL